MPSYPKQFQSEIQAARDAVCALLDSDFTYESAPYVMTDIVRARGHLDTLLDRCYRDA